VRSKDETAMKNEVLAKFVCHNVCCLIMSQLELGIEPLFWGDGEKTETAPEAPPTQPVPVAPVDAR
jgi:hypothetical protein